MITWQQETQSDMFLAAQVESGSSEMPTRGQSGYCLPLQESISGLARRKHSRKRALRRESCARIGGALTGYSPCCCDKSIICLPGQSEAGEHPGAAPSTEVPCKELLDPNLNWDVSPC